MIKDLDETLKQLLERRLENAFENPVKVHFEPPDQQFKPQGAYNVDLFLYDVRENRELRTNDWQIERNGSGGVIKKRPFTRVDCSYLITAWAGDAMGEHNLLGEVLKELLRYPTLPDSALQGELRRQELPLPTAVLQPGRLQSLGEFWQALGGKPKTALNYTVTISVESGEPIELGPPVRDKQIPHKPDKE